MRRIGFLPPPARKPMSACRQHCSLRSLPRQKLRQVVWEEGRSSARRTAAEVRDRKNQSRSEHGELSPQRAQRFGVAQTSQYGRYRLPLAGPRQAPLGSSPRLHPSRASPDRFDCRSAQVSFASRGLTSLVASPHLGVSAVKRTRLGTSALSRPLRLPAGPAISSGLSPIRAGLGFLPPEMARGPAEVRL
jgi:hypothetical protein